jgi:hypothetical protein
MALQRERLKRETVERRHIRVADCGLRVPERNTVRLNRGGDTQKRGHRAEPRRAGVTTLKRETLHRARSHVVGAKAALKRAQSRRWREEGAASSGRGLRGRHAMSASLRRRLRGGANGWQLRRKGEMWGRGGVFGVRGTAFARLCPALPALRWGSSSKALPPSRRALWRTSWRARGIIFTTMFGFLPDGVCFPKDFGDLARERGVCHYQPMSRKTPYRNIAKAGRLGEDGWRQAERRSRSFQGFGRDGFIN